MFALRFTFHAAVMLRFLWFQVFSTFSRLRASRRERRIRRFRRFSPAVRPSLLFMFAAYIASSEAIIEQVLSGLDSRTGEISL